MAKLSAQEREQAKKDLVTRLISAIEKTPRGVTTEEVRECITEACGTFRGLNQI